VKKIRIALAGNANVGKSAIFNYLTGLHQHIANWPGKTVEKAEGTLFFKDCTIDIIDLPGIYSLSAFSIEELISREYITLEKPDVVINVVDTTVLERNLFFTIQLLELETPMVVALNQIDAAKEKGITIDHEKLGRLLGVSAIPTVAIKGTGVYEVLEEALQSIEVKPMPLQYGKEIEERIDKIKSLLNGAKLEYPVRFAAIKLLEGDDRMTELIEKINPAIVSSARMHASEIEKIHGESCSAVIASERYGVASKIAKECQKISTPGKPSLSERLDAVTTHWFLGYAIMAVLLFSTFFLIFKFGNTLSLLIGNFFAALKPAGIESGTRQALLWEGLVGGFAAGITLVLPYVLPFYLLLSLFEDSGYLPRIAFLLDRIMHKMGLHGKAIIPLIMGYGCNVPACFSCRIMETQRDRLISAFVITLVPCTARTVVILALVGAFAGMKWALALYLIDLLLIFALGRIAFKVLPGEATGLIMEMPHYRMPSIKVAMTQTWYRIKSILFIVFPYYIVGGLTLAVLHVAGALEIIGEILSPATVNWLGLPEIAGVLLISGIIRKELVVVMPAILYGTTNLAEIFTPQQMIVLALVAMLYMPCAATIAALNKEFGYKKAAFIALFDTALAVFAGGIALRLLQLFM